ncbi:MAG: hypothetical protein ACF8TS_18075 [Maioricimonas sp. JB049]
MMKTLVVVVLSLFASHATESSLLADDAEKKDKVTLELRLAEEKPAEGLTRKMMRDGSKTVYLHAQPVITNEHFAEVRQHRSRHTPELDAFSLEFTLTDDGGKLLERMSEGHQGRPLAILLNGEVVAAPIVRTKVGKKGVITGGLSSEEILEIVDAFSKR